MKKSIALALSILAFSLLKGQDAIEQHYEAYSPDSLVMVSIQIDKDISFSVGYGGISFNDPDKHHAIISPSRLSLHTEKHGAFGIEPVVRSTIFRAVDEEVEPVVRQKSASIREHYNELTIRFKGNYSLVFRAYNEGVAFRWESNIKDEIVVVSEETEFCFTDDHMVWFPEEESLFTHQEREYLQLPLSEITHERFCSPPALVDIREGPKVLISEANLFDYPGMYLRGDVEPHTLKGKFPRVVVKDTLRSDRDLLPVERADYIARTPGKRSFPWRVIAIAPEDKTIITNQMVFLLSEPSRIEDPSWIKPGKVAWDWWNYNNIYEVPFEAGINTETYKYYIDFAADHGIEYIILDEGWYELGDLTAINPDIDMPALIAHAREKNVGVILWVVWKTLDDQLELVVPIFEAWGVAGLKVDFMQRDDQWMVNYYWKIAEEAAKRKLLVDFHGSYKPSGLHRTWPNVLTREGVRGMEWGKWSDKATPEMAVTLPFIRMWAGPMDYTPGAMLNATKENFRPLMRKPMSQGTRAHQLAMYVVFESPLQMLSDNPTHYLQEEECMDFLSKVPVVWDETVVPDAKLGDYIVVARRNGHQWYIGAMTDWDAREVEIDLSFLGDRKYEAAIWRDGPNAHRNAQDYVKESTIVDKHTRLKIKMAPGGGWAAILSIVRL